MESGPLAPAVRTVMVRRPVRLAGRLALMAVAVQEVTVRIWLVVEPAAAPATWQPLHCEPKVMPVRVMEEPALMVRAEVLLSGPTEAMVAPILQRAAEKYWRASAREPQLMEPTEVLVARYRSEEH